MGSVAQKKKMKKSFDETSVLLVIPLYNHGLTISDVVQKAMATGYAVLVVDDGSSDGGLDTVEDLDCFKLRFDENCGKGKAILYGAKFAEKHGYTAILTIDADGQHNSLEAERLVYEAGSGKWPAIIIGVREMVQDTVPGSSRFGRLFSNFWVRLECGYELEDTQSGMRLYPVKEMLLLDLVKYRYDFEIEVLVKSAWAGVDIRAVSVSVHYPPGAERVSHFDKFADNWRLTCLHTRLVCRRLLPFPHDLLVAEERREKKISVKKPWQTLKNLCLESSSPFWLAVAVWLGLFIGALPLLACHTIVIIYLSFRFELNKIAAVAASQFCMPPVVPVLCIEVGYFMRSGSFLTDLSWERWLLEIHYRLWEWFLGSLLVGPVLGFVGAGIVYLAAKNIKKRREVNGNV